MDINSRHDDDDVLDFLIDLFDDFFYNCLLAYTRSDNTINNVFGSIDLLQWVVDGYILDPDDGPEDHLVIGIDLIYGGLIGTQDLRNRPHSTPEPTSCVNRHQSHCQVPQEVKKELDAHGIPAHFKTLAAWCKQTGHCSQDDVNNIGISWSSTTDSPQRVLSDNMGRCTGDK